MTTSPGWGAAITGCLAGMVILGLVTGSPPVQAAPQDPRPAPPVLRPDQGPIQAPRAPAPVQKPGVRVPLPPRIELFEAGRDCVPPTPGTAQMRYRVSGDVGTIVISQAWRERERAIDVYLNVAGPDDRPPLEKSGITDPYAAAHVTGYVLQAFTRDRATYSQKWIPFRYLDAPYLRLLDEAVRKVDLGGTSGSRRIRYEIAAEYSQLNSISAVYRHTPAVGSVATQPRVTVGSDPPAASVTRGSHVRGTLSFVYSWGGAGAATLWSSPAQADFLGTRDACGEGPVSATAPVR